MLVDPLSNALSKIQNAETARKREVFVSPTSRLVESVVEIMRREGFIQGFERAEEGRGLKVALHGRINRCGAIRPRHSVRRGEIEKWEARFLPAMGFGVLIVSTQRGVMTHREAMEQGLGGRLLAYVF